MKELSFLILISLFLPTGSPVGEIIAAKDTKPYRRYYIRRE